MPGMYEGDDYDLAGFCVGVVEKSRILDGSAVSKGDRLIGIRSSGPHSNGYSLIRKIIEVSNADLQQACGDQTLAQALMAPTQIYVKPLLTQLKADRIHAMAHITGGGLLENIPRVLPENCKARVDVSSWEMPEVFQWLQSAGNVDSREMYRTFNCGIGMVLAVSAANEQTVIEELAAEGLSALSIGEIVEGDAEVVDLVGL